MKRAYIFLIILSLLLVISSVTAMEPKPRIAVIGFTEKASGPMAGHVGKATEDWFTDELVNTKKFKVMERQALASILNEQSFQLSGAVDQLTAVKAGKLLGVQLVVFGNIDFSQKESEAHTNGWKIGDLKVPWGGGKKKTSEGNLTVRLVNVQTGEIIHSTSETVSDSSYKINIMGTGGGSKWDETKVRKVFQPAVTKIVHEIVARVDDIKDSLGNVASAIQGRIVKVKADNVYINLGKIDGLNIGDRYDVVRGDEIVDPDTGQVLGRDETNVGSIIINEILGDHLAIAKIDSSSNLQQGDIVKRK